MNYNPLSKNKYEKYLENKGVTGIEIDGIIQRLNNEFKTRTKKEQTKLGEYDG